MGEIAFTVAIFWKVGCSFSRRGILPCQIDRLPVGNKQSWRCRGRNSHHTPQTVWYHYARRATRSLFCCDRLFLRRHDIGRPEGGRRARQNSITKGLQGESERRHFYCGSRHKWKDACRPYFRPICRSSRNLAQKSFLRCQTNDAHAQWDNNNKNESRLKKSAWTEMKKTQVYGCHQRSDGFFPLSENFSSSLAHKAQPTAVILQPTLLEALRLSWN